MVLGGLGLAYAFVRQGRNFAVITEKNGWMFLGGFTALIAAGFLDYFRRDNLHRDYWKQKRNNAQ